jgi:hypothetical protein
VAVAALVALGGCGSGGNGASPSPSVSTMSDAQILALGKQVAQCIRDNGIPNFPEPYVDRGRLKLPDDQMENLEAQYSQQVLDQAEQACKPLMDKLPESAIKDEENEKQEPGPGDVEALRKFAQCIREHGVPEFPDPKADGTIPLRGTPLESEGKSARMGAAFDACRQYWSGSLAVS